MHEHHDHDEHSGGCGHHHHDGPPIAMAAESALCGLGILLGWVLGGVHPAASLACYVVAYLAGGVRTAFEAIEQLWRGRLQIDLLMIAAALGAAAIGQWSEGAVLLFLFSLSHTLESYAMFRTRRSIDALLQLRPREASRLSAEGVEQRVPVEQLVVGDQIRVRPGESYPVDGEVIEGESWADESTLTGESRPVSKQPGSEAFAGTINGQGSVLLRMTRGVEDTTLEKIVRLVREAQDAQTPTQRLVESWQGPYVACVLAASALAFLGFWWIQGATLGHAFYQAMVMLVVMSPCAVVIGAPAVTLSAIARAAREGVLFKGGAFLERLGEVEVVAFDKTGTLTIGSPTVTGIWPADGVTAESLLVAAARVEQHSEHPLGSAVVAEAARRSLDVGARLAEFHSHSGLGIHAQVGSQWIAVGREELFDDHDLDLPDGVAARAQQVRGDGQTALIVAIRERDEVRGGVIGVADVPRPQARHTIQALRELGIRRTVMLTGDHPNVARAVALEVGVDEVKAGLMPEAKVAELRKLVANGEPLAMVGDGVNDAPALAVADVGIAMGGRGTDVALEVADVVLMRDDLTTLPLAIWLSRQSRRRVRQNLLIAFGVIGVLLVAAFFQLRLWVGVLGHEGSTLLVVLNGLRLFIDQPPASLRADRQPTPP